MKLGFASTDWSTSVKDDRGHPVWGGAGWARLGQYVSLLPFEVAAGSLAFHKGKFGVVDWDGNHHFDCEIIYMQRIMFEDVPNRILEARANGQVIINDIDDWYWGLSPSNGAWAGSHPKNNPIENVNHYKKVLSASTLVTVSTPYLAERISQWVSRPIVLIPNFVETAKFPIRTQTDGVPTVGWVGSTGHRSRDLEILKGVIEPLVRSGEIRLHHSGHLGHAKTFASGVGVPDELVSTLPMAAPSEYQNLFQFDIGLVPLSSTPFNQAKSAIKGLEYSSAAIPFIATDTKAYRSLAEDGVGLIAAKPKHWISHLSKLSDPVLRAELGAKYRKTVEKKYDISQGAYLLAHLFTQVGNAL